MSENTNQLKSKKLEHISETNQIFENVFKKTLGTKSNKEDKDKQEKEQTDDELEL